jgi:hypothetical protein
MYFFCNSSGSMVPHNLWVSTLWRCASDLVDCWWFDTRGMPCMSAPRIMLAFGPYQDQWACSSSSTLVLCLHQQTRNAPGGGQVLPDTPGGSKIVYLSKYIHTVINRYNCPSCLAEHHRIARRPWQDSSYKGYDIVVQTCFVKKIPTDLPNPTPVTGPRLTLVLPVHPFLSYDSSISHIWFCSAHDLTTETMLWPSTY